MKLISNYSSATFIPESKPRIVRPASDMKTADYTNNFMPGSPFGPYNGKSSGVTKTKKLK